MTLNPVFNFGKSSSEQNILESMIIESIGIYGIDLTYIPRTLNNLDEIWVEDAISTYANTYQIEAYVKNMMGYGGDNTFMSQIGLEVRDQITFTVAQKRWNDVMSGIRDRPWEGDVIYLPQVGERFFRVLNVTNGTQFYQLGKLYVYDLVCESMENSSEIFNTANSEINNISDEWSLANSGLDFSVPYDGSAINEEIEALANTVINFDVENPFGEI